MSARDITLMPFKGVSPVVDGSAFVAPGCRIIGDVTIGADCSIWYNCVLRGDVHRITVGPRTNIQDGSIVHVTSGRHATAIGADVLIGHQAVIHGCTLEDRCFVGMGALVMDGCVVEAEAMLAAGAMLTPGKRLLSGQLWAGRPAKYLRDLTPEELAGHRAGIAHYVELGRQHRHALAARAG